MKKRLSLILIIMTLLIASSCLNRQFTVGKHDLVSISDTLINDSAIFVGFAHRVDWPISYKFQGPYVIKLENTSLNTKSDSIGYYYIKTLPGKYTITCQSEGNEWQQLIEKIQNIEIQKNKKIRIDFLVGYATE
jgi:hypothetical protein